MCFSPFVNQPKNISIKTFSPFKIQLISQLKSIIDKPRSDVQYSGIGVGQKWSIADLRTSEEDIPSSFRKIFTTTTFKSSRHSQLSFPNQTNKQGRSSKETFGALQFNSPILVEISFFCYVNILLGANQTSLRRRIPFYLGMMKHFMRKIISKCLPGNLFQNSC